MLVRRLPSRCGLACLLLLPTRTLYKILDSCKQLTLAQGAGEEDPSGMVTVITGLPLDNPRVLSGPVQVGPPGSRMGVSGEEVPGPTPSDHSMRLLVSLPPSFRQPCRPLHTPVWTSRMFWTSTSSGRRLVEMDPHALQWGCVQISPALPGSQDHHL